jgi:hypothetical protein
MAGHFGGTQSMAGPAETYRDRAGEANPRKPYLMTTPSFGLGYPLYQGRILHPVATTGMIVRNSFARPCIPPRSEKPTSQGH